MVIKLVFGDQRPITFDLYCFWLRSFVVYPNRKKTKLKGCNQLEGDIVDLWVVLDIPRSQNVDKF
jgi:hypothetical protein